MQTVLLTGAGAPGASGIIKSLRQAPDLCANILGVDMDEAAYGFAFTDREATVPAGDDPRYIEELHSLAKPTVDTILPLTTPELAPLSRAKERFRDEDITVCVSDWEPLSVANNKALLYEHLPKEGYDTAPEFHRVSSPDAIKRAARSLGYPDHPVVFKPAVSSGQRGFRVLDPDPTDGHSLLDTKPDPARITLSNFLDALNADELSDGVVMEHLPGPEYSVDVLATAEGVPLVVPRTRIRTRKGITFVGEVTRKEALIAETRAVCRDLGLEYVLNFQYKETANGTPKLLEINPRIPGTVVLTVAAGGNLPADAVRLAAGTAIESSQDDIEWGTRVNRLWTEVFTDPDGNHWRFPEPDIMSDR